MLPTISLFGFEIHLYVINLCIAFFGAILFYMIYGKKFDLSIKTRLMIILPLSACLAIAPKLLFWAESGTIVLSFSGLSMFGSIFVFPVAMFAISKLIKVDYFTVLSSATPALAFGLAQAKFGCFLAGCCYGIESSIGWPQVIDPSVTRFPVQLTEATVGYLLMITCLILNKRSPNITGPFYLTFYALTRFLLEFARDNDKDFLGLSRAQIYSIGICLIFLSAMVYLSLRKRQSMTMETKQ